LSKTIFYHANKWKDYYYHLMFFIHTQELFLIIRNYSGRFHQFNFHLGICYLRSQHDFSPSNQQKRNYARTYARSD